MKDFKNYEGERDNESQTQREDTAKKAAGTNDTTVNATVELAKNLTKAFANKSEGDILKTIISQAEEGKRNGTLTNADLDNFYSVVYPLLDSFKRQKLKQVINRLKAL